MGSADPAPDTLGPRYAPDDPTLPKPWKGLIDGSTLYYWNPETNVTQYEKPTTLSPPLPVGLPPTSMSTPLPVTQTVQPNFALAQQGQQISLATQQQGQPINQLPHQQHVQPAVQQVPLATQAAHQQGSQFLHSGQQHGSQLGLNSQQQGPQHPMHHQFSQHPQYPGQHMMQQPGHQVPPQHQGAQLGQPGHQYPQQQPQYMPYQQSFPSQLQQNPHQHQTQNPVQAQPFHIKQDINAGYPKKEEEHQQSNQIGVSPSQSQQNPSFTQNFHHISNQAVNQSGQGPHFGGPNSMQHHTAVAQPQQSGVDMVHPHRGPMFQNQMAPALMHAQEPTVPTAGLNLNYEDKAHGRPGNDFRFSPHLEGPNMGHQHPKLASIPMPRHQQETRIDGAHHPNATPVHGAGMQSMYHQPGSGPGFPNNAMMKPPSNVGNLSQADGYRQQYEITVSGEDVPDPFIAFESTGFPPQILHEMQLVGFTSPTPIQAQTWPISLRGRDIVAIAKTGSGKTLGYLIPIFLHLNQRRNNPQYGPTVLILAPTRELATQIQDEAIKFGKSSRFSCTCLYGGAPKGPQLNELERGVDIVVATPGRLNDILEMKRIDFRQVSLLVLDEADRMLDMGFEPQIRKIVVEIPPRRQTLMFTATWPKEVMKIAGDLLINPVQVNIGRVDELAANKSITQYVEMVPQMEKQRRVEQILRSQERGAKIIIFCSTKRMCDQLTRSIGRNFGAAAIHGDKTQGERDWVLNELRSGKCPILVATDVAARGLDIKDIRVVINYDFPTGVEDYVHRIGRTGRAGATGIAYTFFCDQDRKHAADLVKLLEGANQFVPPEIRQMASSGGTFFGGRGGMRDGSFGGRGQMDTGFGGRGGARDGNFGGRGGMRDGGFGGPRDGGFGGPRDGGFGGPRDGGFGGPRDGGFGGPRDGGFGGRGGMRDGGFGGRGGGGRDGGRNDNFGGNRGRGMSSPGGWSRNERGGPTDDRYNSVDDRGRGGRGRGQIDNRSRGNSDRKRDRSYSSSPERVRTWGGYGKSRSRSRSSRSRSRSWSRSRSRSRSRGRSPSRSPSPVPRERTKRRRESGFDKMEPVMSESQPSTIPPPVSQQDNAEAAAAAAAHAPIAEKNELAGTGNGNIEPVVQS